MSTRFGLDRLVPDVLKPMSWMLLSSCSSEAADLPWTMPSYAVGDADLKQMRAVCKTCPVRNHCREYAASEGVVAAFWAGRWRDLQDAPGFPSHAA